MYLDATTLPTPGFRDYRSAICPASKFRGAITLLGYRIAVWKGSSIAHTDTEAPILTYDQPMTMYQENVYDENRNPFAH